MGIGKSISTRNEQVRDYKVRLVRDSNDKFVRVSLVCESDLSGKSFVSESTIVCDRLSHMDKGHAIAIINNVICRLFVDADTELRDEVGGYIVEKGKE